MQTFIFNGDWKTELIIDGFKGFLHPNGQYAPPESEGKSDGKVSMSIEDELNDDPDPLPEQMAAINYLLNNSPEVVAAIYEQLKEEYPSLQELYDYGDEQDEYFPVLNELADLKNIIGFQWVHVSMAHREGIAYVGYSGLFRWDDEHGFGILMHKDRVIASGQADTAFNFWEAYKDNGTFEAIHKAWEDGHHLALAKPAPKIYQPHPKYGKLKPKQVRENKLYENRLIECGCNEEFIRLVESGKIDINVNKALSMTFLQRATQFSNCDLVEYLLSKQPADLSGVIQEAARNLSKKIVELLLRHGVSINEADYFGTTPLNAAVTTLNIRNSATGEIEDYEEKLDMIKWLLEKGADPYLSKGYAGSAADFLVYLPEQVRRDIEKLFGIGR